MSCPHQGILGRDLNFTIRARSATGAPIDATGLPTFTVYEGDTDSPVSGWSSISMSKDADETGLYFATVTLRSNKFEKYKTYIIDINSVISSISVARTYTFIVCG
jgi:hypothetical protein